MSENRNLVSKFAEAVTKKSKIPGMSDHMLIPVDFSASSLLAVKVGFSIASRMGALPVVIHVYPSVWIGDDADFNSLGMYGESTADIQAAIQDQDLHRVAESAFARFRKKIRQEQEQGNIPDIKFTTLLLEGIPEDVILGYCREQNPRLIVMATRGVVKKEEELIGSVTAEVLDSCNIPVFTVPDNFKGNPRAEFNRILMFCTVDTYDVEALERMINTFGLHNEEVWMMPILSKRQDNKEDIKNLIDTLGHRWPNMTFHTADTEARVVSKQIDEFIERNKIDAIVAPNRKSNLFSRLFKPSVAHQCLFAVDLPMLALPVGK